MLLTEARLKAEETIFAFNKEAQTIVGVKNSLDLDSNGILAYTANKLVEETPELWVAAREPARLSRKDEL